MPEFTGWPTDGPAFLTEITEANTAAFWASHRDRHAASVLVPMRALAAALEDEFGPVRVFRPQVNRRFRPEAPPYRTDTGGVATSAGGCALGVVLSATALTVSAGHHTFDGAQLRRFRPAVAGDAGCALEDVLARLPDLVVDGSRRLVGPPRGYPADHPRLGLLRHRGLQVVRAWPLGPWLATAEPLERVRAAWRAAAPVVEWLDAQVRAAERVPSRPRPDAADRIEARAALRVVS